ncbi:MAG: GNAT family N-acetyltransferase [Rickettsiales bacterium]|jgi:GNAT superfamily N-acetyltransferase|nr:GNAT family N-acetyltransferase [Rickettsiales bacterium]
MDIKIEKGAIKDLPDIQTLNNKLFGLEIANFDPDLIPNWPLSAEGKAYFKDMIENKFVLVARDGGHIIGYFAGTIGLDMPITKGPLAEMDNTFIEEDYRGGGIGRKFFDVFLAECKKRGVYAIRVNASFANKTAIAFYEKLGFKPKNLTLDFKL